jgi:hypothetical protein
VTWINELPSLFGLHLHSWNDNTAQQLHCRHLTSFHAGYADEYPSIWSIFAHHKQLQQLSMYNRHWPLVQHYFPSLTSLHLTCLYASLTTYHLPQLAIMECIYSN